MIDLVRCNHAVNSIFLLIFLTVFVSVKIDASEQDYGLYENKGAVISNEIKIRTTDSVTIALTDLIDKPTLVVPVYYSCPSLCPTLLEGAAELINHSKLIIGKDYQVFAISILPSEPASLAKEAKKQYFEKVGHRIYPHAWRFFLSDSQSIVKLTTLIGWEYKRDNQKIVHTISSFLVTPKGMVSQYFYGTYFNYMHFDMSVGEAWKENTVPTRLKTLKYCYNYKPPKNKAINIVTVIGGAFVLLLVMSLFLYLILTPLEKKR